MMERIHINPRPGHAEKLQSQGLSFHAWDDYWKEDVCYKFTLAQIEEIEAATETLHDMCMQAVRHIIDANRFAELGIPIAFWQAIRDSYASNDFSIYGRFDLGYDGKSPPKMLEYNADTPTSLLESAVCQWFWLSDTYPQHDQFNSVHERLIACWKTLPVGSRIYVASLAENEEDWVCATYMMETILQAGHTPQHIFVEDIGWDTVRNAFVDANGDAIAILFKLYPWEWMMREAFGHHLLAANTVFVEPIWKSVLSCKGLLAILWELFPDHPNLLPAYFDSGKLSSYAKKPLYSREGANIEIVKDNQLLHKDGGPYGAEGYIYQALYNIPEFDHKYPVIGSWVVNGRAAGMCIREDNTLITTNMSHFVPHYFVK